MNRARHGLTIAEFAQSSGLTARALRYYEELGLFTPDRTAGNSRIYSGAMLERARMIAELRTAGMELSEIVEAFQAEGDTALRENLTGRIRRRLDDLDLQRRSLSGLLERLSSEGPPAHGRPVFQR